MHARFHTSLSSIGQTVWDRLAGSDNPFVSYNFLSCLEDSGCAVAETGWQPYHLTLEDEAGVHAAMPLYLKSHSMGEYVFDHAFADAYARAGGQYYPKFLSAVPFTPATGPRLLTAATQANTLELFAMARSALEQLLDKTGSSSLHINFTTQDDTKTWENIGLLKRVDQQFHWTNDGYTSFDHFLEALSSRKRKQLRKERAKATESGLTIRWYQGSDITEDLWDCFFDFYMDTGARKWGRPYLNRDFFSLLGARMGDKCLLVTAEDGGTPIAGALNLVGETTLFGRYWGAVRDVPFLHFEICYYQAIDYAIEHKLARVEAGAQGGHKLARGYTPTPTYSLHMFRDPGFHAAVEDYLEREREDVTHEIDAVNAHYSPFKKTGTPASAE